MTLPFFVFQLMMQCTIPMHAFCLEHSKFKDLKMLDLQTKSTINSDKLQVLHQATSQASQITDTKHLSQHPDNI
jgi:hypothetical protein